MESHRNGHGMSLDDLARVRGLLTHAPVRMGLIVLFVALGFAAWNLSSQPVYRSSVKLRVDDVTAKRPQIEHRSIPTGTIDEGQALTILRSRALIGNVVADADGGLGLTTWVTDENAPPLRRMLRSAIAQFHSSFQLQAVATRLNDKAPTAVRVRFVSPSEVSVSTISVKPGVEWPEDDAEVFAFEPGAAISYHGLELQLSTEGSVDGRVWRVESLTQDQAIDRVLQRLRVDKQQHQTGTLALIVQDDDPVRAAAIANSVAAAFVRADLDAAKEDALKTARFLEEELEERRTRLDALNVEVAELQGNNPDTFNPDATALDLGSREGGWDDLYRKARNRRILAKRVELMIASGQPLRTALSAVGGEHSPEIRSMLASLDAEESQLRQVFRGAGQAGYRETLLLKADDYRIDAERFRSNVIDLRDIIGRLESGDITALSRIGGDLARDGSIAADLSMREWLAQVESSRSELAKLEAEFNDQYPPVRVARKRMEYYVDQVKGGLSAVLVGYENSLAQKVEYAETWSALHDAYPESEAQLIRASIEQIEKEIVAAFSAHVKSLQLAETAAQEEVLRLRERLKDLALGEQKLKGVQLQTRELDRVVGDLVRDVENAHVAAAGIVPSARIIDSAVVPRSPLKPNAVFGLVAGLVLGMLLALTWAWFDLQRGPAGSAPSDSLAESRLRALPICGRVAITGPANGEARQMRLVRSSGGPTPSWLPILEDPESPAAQTYRTLRARLKYLTTASGDVPKVIGLTSAEDAGGSSTVAVNLAMARAQLGERVLVVDADIHRPSLRTTILGADLEPSGVFGSDVEDALGARTRGSQNARGLAECLDGSAHWSDVARPSGFPQLDVLYTGDSAVIPADLVASQMFDLFCDETRAVYDLVLVAMPAMTPTPEAEAAAGALDGWLFVESEINPVGPAIVDDCVQRLQQAGGHVLGLVKTIAIERRRSRTSSGLSQSRGESEAA